MGTQWEQKVKAEKKAEPTMKKKRSATTWDRNFSEAHKTMWDEPVRRASATMWDSPAQRASATMWGARDSLRKHLELPAEKNVAGPLAARFQTTIEVMGSKIFPAGAGWQGASILADSSGFAPDTLGFALSTGVGDFAGVFLGHTTYSLLKLQLSRGGSIYQDTVTGLWLASAAFCSGTAWQPAVNLLHDTLGCSFVQTAVGTGALTGLAFFGGLRAGRSLYTPLGLDGASEANLKYDSARLTCRGSARSTSGLARVRYDATLSVSIGAATGTFVGTDPSFGAANFLGPYFGISEGCSDLGGMVR